MAEESKPGGEVILYQMEDLQTRLQVRLDGETAWLSLNHLAELFQRDKSVISKHLKNIFEEGELDAPATVANFATVQTEGQRTVLRNIEFYNLDAIIAVGYRVKSARGTQFRVWATQRLKEYVVKGFVLDDERLKQAGGGGYFEELLARIRDIRSSEKVFWRKVLDLSRPAWITTRTGRFRRGFSRRCKTKCTGRRMATQRRKSFMRGRTRPSRIWA